MSETNPAAEVSQPVSPEAQLEEYFKRQGDDTPPEEVEAEAEEVPEDEPTDEKSESTDEESDAEETEAKAQPEETAEDAEEVEYEGKAYKVPKELKDALLRQADYTRKTQEVAETRKAVEQRAEEVRLQAEFQQAHGPKLVDLRSLETQLSQYAQVDWQALIAADPAQAMTLQIQRDALRDRANTLKGELQQLAHEHGQKAVEFRQQAQARCIEQVRKDIKGLDADMLRSIDETARTYGFTGEELAQVTDPRVVKVLHAAMQYQKMQGAISLATKKVQEVKPVTVKTSRTAVPNQQSSQLKAARDRMKTTGKPDDAVSFLTAKFARMR